MSEYTEHAKDFLRRANATMTISFRGYSDNPNWGDSEMRNHYNVTIKTPRGEMYVVFWDSVNNIRISRMTFDDYVVSKCHMHANSLSYTDAFKLRKAYKEAQAAAQPTEYDVLACLQKYDPGTLEEFCSEFGCSTDSIRANKMYIACIREYKDLERIFTAEQMVELREIY